MHARIPICSVLAAAVVSLACNTGAPREPGAGAATAAESNGTRDPQARSIEPVPAAFAMITSEPAPRPGAALAPGDPDFAATDRGAAGTAAGDDDVEEAVAAARAGDYVRARRILAGLIVARNIETARELLAQGRARDALLPLDEALELEPRRADVLFLRGVAAFETAPSDSQPQFFYEDALANFEAARRQGYGIEAVFAASRAARLVPAPERALELVRYGAKAIESQDERPALDVPLERTWAEAAFDVYRDRKINARETEAYFAETEDQLERLLGRTPDDPWVYTQLANLYQWEERPDDALAMLERALALAPADETLHNRVVDLIRAKDGREAVIQRYRRFRREYPEVALGAWYTGVETFYVALEQFESGADAGEAFTRAEQDFARCRELEPAYDQACRGYEIMARDGNGWCRFKAGDLEGAKQAFMSMEDLREGGLRTTLAGENADGERYDRLPSGVAGLGLVTGAYMERALASQDVHDVRDDLNAAAIADYLHAYDPTDANLADDAGFLNRDAAIALERESRIPRFAARGKSDGPKKAELLAEADRLLERAEELMERSYAAYTVAAALAPDDVRIVNDAGLVMAYYLRSDPDAAERYFTQAVRHGTEQLAGKQLTGGMNDLEEAWGDAHQNLGVLYLTLKNDPATAREWYVKAVEIGPPNRQWIAEDIIPMCDRLVLGGELTPEDRQKLDEIVWLHNPR